MSLYRDVDINPPPTDIPIKGFSKEEQLALALKASMDAIPIEQAARVASCIYDRAPDISSVFSFLFEIFSLLLIGYYYLMFIFS